MEKRHTSGLVIPSKANGLKPPKYACAVCGSTFTEDEKPGYLKHVVKCAEDHEEELHNASLRNKAPGIFAEDDMERWVRENREALLEDRKKL